MEKRNKNRGAKRMVAFSTRPTWGARGMGCVLSVFIALGLPVYAPAALSLEALQGQFQGLKKDTQMGAKRLHIAFYRYSDPPQGGKQRHSYRALVYFLGEQGQLRRDLFLDWFRRIEIDLATGERRLLLDWDSFYWQQPNHSWINLNDEHRDGQLEATNNGPNNQNLLVIWDNGGWPEVRDQVLTCATATQVKGLGTKSWLKSSDFIYSGRYFSDCPDRSIQFEALYQRVSETEAEQVFFSL